MIECGSTAFLKTTGEEVFVLGIGDATSLPIGSTLTPKVATVRRPVMGENGMFHMVEQFYLEELELKEDQLVRKLEEQREFERMLDKARKESGVDEIASGGTGNLN